MDIAGICCCCQERSSTVENGLCEACRAKKAYIDYLSDPVLFEQKTLRICGEKREMRTLRTKHLMSRLNHSCSDDPFDVLILEGFIDYNNRYLDLVIVPGIPEAKYNTMPFDLTMTDLKTDKGYRIRRKIERSLDDETSITVPLDSTHHFILMQNAYILRAMTYADMNYGDRWYGQDYCEEGNKYGDTSDFYIIGAIDWLDKNTKHLKHIFFFN